MKLNTKNLIIVLASISLSGFSQTNPKITLTGTSNQATIYKGAVGANTAMLLPEGTHEDIYPDLPKKGRIQLNSVTNKLEVHNGTEWVEVGSGGGIAPITAQEIFEKGSSVALDTTIEYRVTAPDSTQFSAFTLGVNEYDGVFNSNINMFSTQHIGAWSVGDMSLSANQSLNLSTPGTLSVYSRFLNWSTNGGSFQLGSLDYFQTRSISYDFWTNGGNYWRMNDTDGIFFNTVYGNMSFQSSGFGEIKFDHDNGLIIDAQLKKLSIWGGFGGIELSSGYGNLKVSGASMEFNGGTGLITVPFNEEVWSFFRTNVTSDPNLNGYSLIYTNDEETLEQSYFFATLVVDGSTDSYYFDRYESENGIVFRATEITGTTIVPIQYQKYGLVAADMEMMLPERDGETDYEADVVFVNRYNKLRRGKMSPPKQSFMDVLNENPTIDTGLHFIPMNDDSMLLFYGYGEDSPGLLISDTPNPSEAAAMIQIGTVDAYANQKIGLSIYKNRTTVTGPAIYTDDQAYYSMKDNGDVLASANFVRQGFIEYKAWAGLIGSIGQQHYFIDVVAQGSEVYLPDATYFRGKKYIFKHSFGAGTASIKTVSGQTIDGSNILTLSVVNQTFEIVSDGSNWKILSAYKPG